MYISILYSSKYDEKDTQGRQNIQIKCRQTIKTVVCEVLS